jgi:cell division protein FtsI (penicillin-binding protein 3)
MKPFVVAAAIDRHKTSVNEMHDCENGVYRVGGVVFRDDHPAAKLTTAETIIRSSNICTFKIANRIGKQGLFDALLAFGFSGGLALGETFPLTVKGHISKPTSWKPIRFANVAFGQGMTVNGLEIAMAYGVLANGGNLMRPILVDRIISPNGDIVYAATPEAAAHVVGINTATEMRKILARVVTDPRGTASKAETADYSTGGKTGTAEKVDPLIKAYSPDKRISSFAGFAPVNDPYLVIYVMIDEPAVRPAYGGLLAGPVFSEIAQRALRYLNVAPDKNSLSVGKISPKLPANRAATVKEGHHAKKRRRL